MEECENCMGPAEVFCEECGDFYCSTCSHRRHLKRLNHTFTDVSSTPSMPLDTENGESWFNLKNRKALAWRCYTGFFSALN